MSDRVRLDIPGKPVGKGRPRSQGRIVWEKGKPRCAIHIHTPDETIAQEARIADVAREVMAGHAPLTGPIRLHVVSTFEVPPSWPKRYHKACADGLLVMIQKPDWDNLGKITDALDGIVWENDAQVTIGTSEKRFGLAAGVDILVESAAFPGMVLPPIAKTKPKAPKSDLELVREGLRKPRKKGSRRAPAVTKSLVIGKRIR